LQRLFSTFPNGWPGVGLLLVRLCLGFALIYFGGAGSLKAADEIALVQNLIAAAGGSFLLTGLWTPLTGGLVALEEASKVLSLSYQPREATWCHAFLAVLCVSVAMLGPGAWSIDARLFGRRRFDIDRTGGRKAPRDSSY
jgi:putative oxidoreductase